MQHLEQQPVLLLVDDEPSIHRLLAFKLKDEGLEFLTAFTGSEGYELATTHQPSLILLDLGMPDQDGFSTLRSLKNDSRTIGIPVIVLSGTTNPDDKVRAFDLGAMDFVTKPFDIHELRARITSAIRIHRLMQMLEKRAQIDGLTGLWNRAHFNDRLLSEIACVERNQSRASLVICDLDHFKKVNDSFGHPAGDAVLQTFAKVLTSELRTYDIPCRYGGEEFALILPETSVVQAVTICERIRQSIESRRWPNYPEINVTASFGVTDGSECELAPAAWIDAADKSLYEAKQSGRNRIVTYQDLPARSTLRMAG